MDERYSYTWDELNRGCRTKMSAVHTYIVERPMPTRSVETAGLKHWPLLAAVVGTPIALVIIQVMAAALGH